MQIMLDVPNALARQPPAQLGERARLLLAIDDVRYDRLTRAGAARALGLSLDDFVLAAGEHGLYAIDYEVEDFRRELDDARTGA